MTVLSVNVNKIALLRNSRGRDFPNVVNFVERVVNLGVKGITVHPRPDQRHITRRDVYDISAFLKLRPDVEFNIEGYPSEQFMELVLEVLPAQCTLVPDDPAQLTSDHGWDVAANAGLLKPVLNSLADAGIRSSLFLDAEPGRVAESPPSAPTASNSTPKTMPVISAWSRSGACLNNTRRPPPRPVNWASASMPVMTWT